MIMAIEESRESRESECGGCEFLKDHAYVLAALSHCEANKIVVTCFVCGRRHGYEIHRNEDGIIDLEEKDEDEG